MQKTSIFPFTDELGMAPVDFTKQQITDEEFSILGEQIEERNKMKIDPFLNNKI